MLTFLLSLLPQRYSRTSICDDKELCPTFFVCPAFASEPQAGEHGRKHSEPYETHYFDGTRRPRVFHAARERSGSETHRHQLRTGRRRSLRQWHSDQSANPRDAQESGRKSFLRRVRKERIRRRQTACREAKKDRRKESLTHGGVLPAHPRRLHAGPDHPRRGGRADGQPRQSGSNRPSTDGHPLGDRLRPARRTRVLPRAVEHSCRGEEHQRDPSDDHALRGDAFVQHPGTHLRKLARRADRNQGRKNGLRNAGQAFQCTPGPRPTGDQQLFHARTQGVILRALQNETACRNQRSRPIPFFAPVSVPTRPGFRIPHHRTPGEALPECAVRPALSAAKPRHRSPAPPLFRLRRPGTRRPTAPEKPPAAIRLPHLTASTLPNPRKTPVGPRPTELPRTVRAAGKPRTTGKRKTDRPQRAVRSSIRHAAVRTLSGAKSSVRDSDTRNRRKVPD